MKTLNGKTLNDIINLLESNYLHRRKGSRYRYKQAKLNGKNISLHRKVATLALGHDLPPGAIVHHLDGNRHNNSNTNLVICPNEEYHDLLHKRTEALFRRGQVDYILSVLNFKGRSAVAP